MSCTTLAGLRAITRVALTRIRANPFRGVLVAVGVAAASATLVGVQGGGLIAAELRAAVADAPPQARALTVRWAGSAPADGIADIDQAAREALTGLASGPVARSMLQRESNLDGRGVVLGAVDGVAQWVRLESGRMPGPCLPQRCEVVRILGEPRQVTGIAGARLAIVGTATLTSQVPFGDLAGDRQAQAPAFTGTPVLLTGDTDGLSALPGLSFVYRTYSWRGEIDRAHLRPWRIDALMAREGRMAQSLAAIDPAFSVASPDRALLEARSASRSASTRILLIGGAAAALLLGFALLAAGSLRQDHSEELARLARRGAGPGLRLTFTVLERVWMTLAGLVVGWLLALGVVAWVARRADVQVSGILGHSLLAPSGLMLAAGIWAAATIVLVAAQHTSTEVSRVGRLRMSDLVAVAAVGAVGLAAARGSATSAELASGAGDPLLPAMPVLLSLAGGIAAARVFPPLLRWAERHTRGAPVSVRLALLALARRPARAALTTAFLVVGLGLGAFAESYRATLDRGHRDQAAFVIPADVTVTADASGRAIPDLTATASGVRQSPVVRVAAAVTGASSIPTEGVMLGLPTDRLAHLPGWRGDFADLSAGDLARRLIVPAEERLAGVDLPADLRSVAIQVTTTGQTVDLWLVVQTPDGASPRVRLHPVDAQRLGAQIPPGLRGGRLIALEAAFSPAQLVNFTHAEGEGRGGDLVHGTVALGPLTAASDGAVVTDWRDWIARGAMSVREAGATPILRYGLPGLGRALLRPAQVSDTVPLPVLVRLGTAERVTPGTVLTLRPVSGGTLRVRVVGTSLFAPTVPSGAVLIADQRSLSMRLDADNPGAGHATEAWVEVPDSARHAVANALATAPNDRLGATWRTDREARLRGDPLGRGIAITLSVASVVALLLGVVALLLAVLSDLRDERRELRDLAAQGVSAATLRRQLRLRGGVLVVLSVIGGVLMGLVLSTLVVRLVAVAAGSAVPIPPLVHSGGWAHVGIGLLVFSALAIAATLIATQVALRHRRVETEVL
jgi:hypothetical protein